jgi:glutamine transport system permease protein
MGQLISQYTGAYLTGFALSLLISVIVIGFSILIGTFAAIGRTSRHRAFRMVTAFYVAVFRGLPPILTLYLVYFGLPSFAESADVPLLSWLLRPLDNRIVAAVVGFMLSSGAYSTEIIRAGIASVKKEQIDAARSIGMTYGLAFRRVIAPQAFRTAFPPLSNEYITVLKATSLASVSPM